MKKISLSFLSFLLLFSCSSKTNAVKPDYIPSNEPYYCSAPTKKADYEFVEAFGLVRKNKNSSTGYSFVSFDRLYHGFTGVIDSNTIIYKDKYITKTIESESENAVAFFSTEKKADDVEWMRIYSPAMAENVTYLIIGEMPDELNGNKYYYGHYFE